MKIEDLFSKREGATTLDLNPFNDMSTEEIEQLLELMTEQGLLEKTEEGGFQLTKKGIRQARLQKAKEFLNI